MSSHPRCWILWCYVFCRWPFAVCDELGCCKLWWIGQWSWPSRRLEWPSASLESWNDSITNCAHLPSIKIKTKILPPNKDNSKGRGNNSTDVATAAMTPSTRAAPPAQQIIRWHLSNDFMFYSYLCFISYFLFFFCFRANTTRFHAAKRDQNIIFIV